MYQSNLARTCIIHYGPMTLYGNVELGSDNGLVSLGTKSLPEPVVTYHQQCPVTSTKGQFHKGYISHHSLKWASNHLTSMSFKHYDDVIMGTMASQITSVTGVYSTIYSGAAQGKHQSSASLAFVWGIHRWPVNSPHKRSVTPKMFPFDDVIMISLGQWVNNHRCDT